VGVDVANEFARKLRQNMTAQEVKLWIQLRHLAHDNFPFRRQVPIGRHIVDFAELKRRVVIEVDGSQHGETKGAATDEARDQFLSTEGFLVLRFWNYEIDRHMDGVIDCVIEQMKSRPIFPRRTRNPTPVVSQRTLP
jgi:very-short-patch-repair endonuclease